MLKRKSGDQAVELLDFKVHDLRKKLNKLRYQSRSKQQRIESLMKEYEKVVTINAEAEKAEEILEDSAEGQRLRYELSHFKHSFDYKNEANKILPPMIIMKKYFFLDF